MKWLIAIVCLLAIGFAGFGFLASFEPGVANAITYRIGYAILTFVSLLGLAFLFLPRSKQ